MAEFLDRILGRSEAPHTPPTGLRVRKHADRTQGPNPDGSWPLAGLSVVGDIPARTRVSTSWVARGQAEGWLELVNARPVHRAGGPPEEPWRLTHTFLHGDTVVLKTLDGDVRYRVRHQPDKYHAADNEASVTDEAYNAGDTRVDWFYDLELED